MCEREREQTWHYKESKREQELETHGWMDGRTDNVTYVDRDVEIETETKTEAEIEAEIRM